MKRETFARLCLVLAVVGLVTLFVADQYLRMETVNPGEISAEDIGRNVKVKGEASNIYSGGGVTYFDLKGNGSVQVAVFQEVGFAEGENLTVYGTVKMYRGNVQITAARIDR